MKNIAIVMKVGIDFMTGHLKNCKRGDLCLESMRHLFPQFDFVSGVKFLLTISDTKSEGAIAIGLIYPKLFSRYPRWVALKENMTLEQAFYPRWVALKENMTLEQVIADPSLERETVAGIFLNPWTDGNVYSVLRRLFGRSAKSGTVWIKLTPIEKAA